MLNQRLRQFLGTKGVKYDVIPHPPRFTSQEIAAVEHVPGDRMAKVVMVEADGKSVMLVLPATRTVDLLKLGDLLGASVVRVEEEKEFAPFFPDCEPGAMPPFGQLYGLPCYVDESLLARDEIFFNGGTHGDSVKIDTRDFVRIAGAKTGDFGAPAHAWH
jgi:Ala-tRNA(Pro) deacylase